MSGWRPLADPDPDRMHRSVGHDGLDLSERNVEDLWRVAAEYLPQEPDRQALVVTMAVRLRLCPVALAARCRRIRREAEAREVRR